MVDFDNYLKGLLNQIFESYQLLTNLEDKTGDLEIIKKELAKIKELLQVIINKLNSIDNNSNDCVELLSASDSYVKNYDFFREIETMSKLYSEDPHRLQNLRQTIIDSFNDEKLIEKIESLMEKL
jgi:DNA repair ATPase RecN